MIVFTGVAGSGKSSQGKSLADSLGLPWISTGEFLRMLVSGERRKEMVEGKLLGDKEIIAMVQKILTLIDTRDEFVMDGFPRTPQQGDWLLNQVKHGQLSVTAIINLEADKSSVKQRLLKRGRPDDNEAAIKARFDEDERYIAPLLNDFRQRGVKVIDIDASQDVEKVQRDIIKSTKKLLS